MNNRMFSKLFKNPGDDQNSPLQLGNGSKVAVIGGGPAGSLFSYFLLDMAERVDISLYVDIYEPRDFNRTAPIGCNMCGGVLYESLVQSLAVEGINLPPTVVQRGIEYNMLHLDIGSTKIQTPRHEKRIATTFRGAGPRDLKEVEKGGLDSFLLKSAISRGARHIQERVDSARRAENPDRIDAANDLWQIKTRKSDFQTYEFLTVTSGVNTAILNHFQELDFGYQPPQTTKLFVREYQLGEEAVTRYIGPVFHAFLLDIPGLDYGAVIPKGKYMTICLLSSHGGLEPGVMDLFLSDPAVQSILPPNFDKDKHSCHCGPKINVMGCKQPFGDRIVFIGDSGVSRLYKDGIGAAYRSSKVAASTAIFHGISADDFKRHYLPFCQKVDIDNRIGKFLFTIISQIQKMKFSRRAVLRMVSNEQKGKANPERGMSMLMWDMLTGGAPYKEALIRALNPIFWARFLWNITLSLISSDGDIQGVDYEIPPLPQAEEEDYVAEETNMELGALGKVYENGEIIVRQDDTGDCMYVIQDGLVEVIFESEGKQVQLNILGKDDFFGEMAIFNEEVRTATVRALGKARILTVDHKNLLRCIHEDPSLAFRIMQEMATRIDKLSEAVSQLTQDSSG